MKQFLYLDTDIVNSIIAQSEKGLITQKKTEQGSSLSNNSSQSANATGETSGSLGGFWKFIEMSAKISGTVDLSHSSGTQSSSKNVVEKILHDAAFDIAYNCINPSAIAEGDQDHDSEGNYLEIKRVFDFVDLDYLEMLFAEGGLIEYIKKSQADNIEKVAEEAKGDYNREQLRKMSTNFRKEVNKVITANNKQYDEIKTIIKAIRSFIPYNRMLISSDGYLIPLDEKYFRVDPKNLGFRYGGEITCVGMVTNIFGTDTTPNDNRNIFAMLQYTANISLKSLLPTTEKNICVIHPIAVYYGGN